MDNTNKKIHSDFKREHSYEVRCSEARRILQKYPQRLPIICERARNATIGDIDKKKYLVPSDLTVGQFSYIIRKRIKLKPEEAIFILVNNTFPSTSAEMCILYEEHKDEDGFLYIQYNGENTFGF